MVGRCCGLALRIDKGETQALLVDAQLPVADGDRGQLCSLRAQGRISEQTEDEQQNMDWHVEGGWCDGTRAETGAGTGYDIPYEYTCQR